MSVARFNYTVHFLCPAFLGNAEQSGQWRTPPFKALLRQWWRVAYAADHGFSVNLNQMRAAEGWLFGAAADAGDSRQSQVRLRLDRWEAGKLKNWQSLTTVPHPEVGRPVGSDLYLGYGPLTFEAGKTAIKKGKTAIDAGERATLRIALMAGVPKAELDHITKAISLINLYGTLGGRSRNGWGSFALSPLDGTPAISSSLDPSLSRPWLEALRLDWPHAIGQDEKGVLIWQTEVAADWKNTMKQLAEIKIALRTQFKFPDRRPPHPEPLARHWFSYPITKHVTDKWPRNARLPNSLRFKLRPADRELSKLLGVIFHIPCFPPPEFKPSEHRRDIETMWKKVHASLDNDRKLLRIPT
jgi:CRISPR-associated protein Cmr1